MFVVNTMKLGKNFSYAAKKQVEGLQCNSEIRACTVYSRTLYKKEAYNAPSSHLQTFKSLLGILQKSKNTYKIK